MTFCISVFACRGRQPTRHIRDFADVRAATEYALQAWPMAILVAIKPVKVINLHQEAL